MKKIFLILCLIVTIIACTKTSVDSPADFTVSVNQTTFSVNDTVVFNLTGNPDFITFYSGMPHSKYLYTSDTSMQADSSILSFSTATTAAGSSTQPLTTNYVSLLASTNFNGIMDSANIRMATWTDITTKANLATGTTTVASGNIRLDTLGLTSGNTPLFIAYKYISDTAKANYLSRKWVLSAFNLKSYFPDTTYVLANNFTSGGFNTASLSNAFDTWTYGNVSSITQSFTFNAPAVGSMPDEDWAISRPFNLSQYPADLGIVIKNISQSHFNTYKMTQSYKTPGNYLVTFVARNQYEDNIKTVVRQITLTITP